MEILKDGFTAEQTKYKKIAKRKRNANDEVRDSIIDIYAQKWIDKWKKQIRSNMHEKHMDHCANSLQEMLNKVYSQCHDRKVVTVPISVQKDDSAFDNEILQYKAQCQKLCFNIHLSLIINCFKPPISQFV